MRGPVALLTDFGTVDPFVGVMKGVILSIHPTCALVDITHQIPPQDVRAAAHVLASARPHFPEGTVFLCVVDPGVGGDRRPIAAEGEGHRFVAPDSGILTLTGPFRRIVEITREDLFRKPVSRTFHGRDIFAPVAAHLSKGMALSGLGPEIHGIREIPISGPLRRGGEVRGEVVRIDRFGNLITNLRPEDLPQGRDPTFRIGRRRIRGLISSYDRSRRGRPLAIVGSDGFVEIAVRDGSAAETIGAVVGTPVTAAPTGRP
jgi:S-adenosylmethionine hydrolase